MKYIKINLKIVFCTFVLLINTQAIAEEGHAHDEPKIQPEKSEKAHKNKDKHEEEGIQINQEKRKGANIVVKTITPTFLAKTIKVPAEIKVHGYRSQVITPRISSMVIERHVALGDNVEKNYPLATLFSVEMAEAQGDFVVASTEWSRVKKLGKSVVSGKRYVETKVNYEQANARLQAYGMAKAEIGNLLKNNKNHKPGHFTLFSNQSGVITSDDFKSGEIIEPGRTIFDIVDERILWVEAHLNPEYSNFIKKGDKAWVYLGKIVREAIVAQKSHVLDETTRTLTIRLEVDNEDHLFAPGQFVDVEIMAEGGDKVLAVPSEAVLRSSDGDWQIFIENEKGSLVPIEIDVVRSTGDKKVISGIQPGTKVVTQGAFFVQSEIAKGGFDIHNH